MTSTFRADTRRRMYELIVAYKATDSGIRETWKTRPKSFANSPGIYVGRISEVSPHSSGIRQRRLNVPLVIVGWGVDNIEQQDALDGFVDGLQDFVTDNWQWIAGALIEPTGVDPIELANGETDIHAGEVVNVLAAIQEPRR